MTITMKKLTICLAAFAVASVLTLQAGEQCCKEKTATTAQTKAACSAKTETASKSCCSAKKVVRQNLDIKGAALLVRR